MGVGDAIEKLQFQNSGEFKIKEEDKTLNGENKEERIERLQRRLEHWVDHNKDHAESFRKAAREAEVIGLVDVSKLLREAAKSMDESSALLDTAMKKLS
ncbi:hypothetical protein DRN97_01190 [Methanosarcinales archaeon]|nr:MAG: hypothetical protein DRN97_01190 [Methanosarcinales archaeon]